MNTLNTRTKSIFKKSLSLIMATLFVLGAFTGCGKTETSSTVPTTAKSTPTTEAVAPSPEEPVGIYVTGNYNPLTGEGNYSADLLDARPILMSVENHPDARPQWGISSADVVWEMVAEGGITRMLLMFSDVSRLPDKVGPTRSARHYFVSLAEGFDAIFVHFGWSPLAQEQIQSHGVNNINGLYDNYFYRDNSRNVATEHTAYTTRDAITKAIADKGFRTEIKDGYSNPLKFYSDVHSYSAGACTEFTVPFSNGYTYTLTYNETDKVYYSSLGSKPFMDDNGTQQSFTNVIMCYANVTSIAGDSKGRQDYDLSSGEGYVFSNGTYEKITWKKGDSANIMKFYGADGNELALNVGRTYIALVPASNQSSTTIR